MQQGSLVCVGTGMTLGSHISPISRNCIEQADVVFVLVADGITEQWIESMNADVRSLQPYYCEGQSRMLSYQKMLAAMITEVKAGKNVVGAFYGHPGVFAWVPHKAIEMAREEGYQAFMEPGISAEDCLYADLGIDPGTYGCQHYEASQLIFYQTLLNPAAYLIIWQPGVAGDRSLAKFSTGPEYKALLLEVLLQSYPAEHEVLLYEAANLAIQQVRLERLPLSALVNARIDLKTTLVIPPTRPMAPNHAMLEKLKQLEQQD
ncbi:SAM-dependent methyltransferase [Alkalimonas delamerensis]|uniref:SAM-dependent methyltransferase n=1 Tax=Alkalimonas delamerensis TaxID=265981 RepID=A0ABT9GNK0_9GAMM|nr:SAM-dependent methyltransferase [Alkalimonas delamerensis]MDP4528546.1 SAM-dependent methyltransferase [Alkalimonas delamerensis]